MTLRGELGALTDDALIDLLGAVQRTAPSDPQTLRDVEVIKQECRRRIRAARRTLETFEGFER